MDFRIVKYIGGDKDEPEWDEGPFETQAEADKILIVTEQSSVSKGGISDDLIQKVLMIQS